MGEQPQPRKPGVCYAKTDEGIELPVIDVTNPAFALETDAEGLSRMAEESLRSMEQVARMPGFLRSFIRRRSVLMGGSDGKRPFMTGMTTYLNKLGPDDLAALGLGGFDLRVSRMISCAAVRFRLLAVAELLADALAPALATPDGRPVRLLNVAGGTACDSLNALILLNAEDPESLRDRDVQVRVLDLEEAGPRFAARSLSALLAPEGPLAGLAVEFEHLGYDWSDAQALRLFLKEADSLSVICAGSSEGGLFEYGSDADIAANLAVLREATPDDFAMVGTLWRDSRITRAMQRTSPLTFVLRELEPFAALVGDAGWRIDRSTDDNPVYHIVRLVKA